MLLVLVSPLFYFRRCKLVFLLLASRGTLVVPCSWETCVAKHQTALVVCWSTDGCGWKRGTGDSTPRPTSVRLLLKQLGRLVVKEPRHGVATEWPQEAPAVSSDQDIL